MQQLKEYQHNSYMNNDSDRYTYFELHFKLTNIFVHSMTFKNFLILKIFNKHYFGISIPRTFLNKLNFFDIFGIYRI